MFSRSGADVSEEKLHKYKQLRGNEGNSDSELFNYEIIIVGENNLNWTNSCLQRATRIKSSCCWETPIYL